MRFHRIRLWLNSKREQRNLRRDQQILQSLSNMYSSVSESLAAKDIVINNLRMIDDKCPELKKKIDRFDSEKEKKVYSAILEKLGKKSKKIQDEEMGSELQAIIDELWNQSVVYLLKSYRLKTKGKSPLQLEEMLVEYIAANPEKKPIYYHLLINLKKLASNFAAPNNSP